MKGNILLRDGAKINKVMRGFAAPIQLVVILTVVFAGLLVLLGTWSGSTPIYYQNMPESKFGDLLMSYEHVKENVNKAIDMDSEKMFANMADTPIRWKDIEGKTLDDAGWGTLYFSKFNTASGSYFGSVNNLGFEWINIDFKGSSMAYCTGGSSENPICKATPGKAEATPESPKLIWNFIYRVEIQNVIPSNGIVNKINSTETKTKVYENFISLDDAKDCAKDFFAKAGGDEGKISFSEESEYFVREAVLQKINLIAQSSNSPSSCQNFDLSTDIFTEDLCSQDSCNGGKMEPISYILFIKGKSEGESKRQGAISFMNDFANFGAGSSGQIAILEKCVFGSECSGVGEYCVKGVCGQCYAGLEEADCSPAGTNAPLGSYKCYKAIKPEGSVVYKCLEKKELVYLTYQGSKISSGKIANINCGLKNSDPLILEGIDASSDPEVFLNGVKLPIISGSGGRKVVYPCGQDNAPQASGPIEIYLNSGSDRYKAYGASAVYAIDSCISGISRKLDGLVYSFSEQESGKAEVSFAELRSNVSKAILDKIGRSPCEGYETPDINISLSCKDACRDADTTTWSKEKYSLVTLEFREKSSGQAAAIATYIISYAP